MVVEILPKSEWKGVSKSLKVAGANTSSDNTHTVITGTIVGRWRKDTYDIVASFPVSR